MKNKNEILNGLINKKLSFIGLKQGIQNLAQFNKEFITHDSITFIFGEVPSFNKIIELNPVVEHLINHTNPYKLKISDFFEDIENNSIANKYPFKLKLDFEISAIYQYEECLSIKFLSEVKESMYCSNTMHLTDKTGLQNIVINTYEIPGEQYESELKIRFFLGEINSDKLKIDSFSEIKYINLTGNKKFN